MNTFVVNALQPAVATVMVPSAPPATGKVNASVARISMEPGAGSARKAFTISLDVRVATVTQQVSSRRSRDAVLYRPVSFVNARIASREGSVTNASRSIGT